MPKVREDKKFNPDFPDASQHARDRCFSTLGALQMSGYEILWLHLCGLGTLSTVTHGAAPLWCARPRGSGGVIFTCGCVFHS